MTKSGILTVGGMPIGNNNDMSIRMVKAIETADIILTEDINIFNKFCFDMNISINGNVIEYYHKINNENQLIIDIRKQILDGSKVLLVSSDGMPNICDPGSDMIRMAHENKLNVTVIPGPSIVSVLPSISGLNTTRFTFEEKLPVDRLERIQYFYKLKSEGRSFMFIIANRRYQNILFSDILKDLEEVFSKYAVVCAGINLTRHDEKILFGEVRHVAKEWDNIEYNPETNISVFVNASEKYGFETGIK